MLQIIQEESKKLQDQQEKKIPSAICSLLCSLSIILTFAALFLVFQNEEDKYNNCDNIQLRNWSLATSIYLFISAFILLVIKITKLATSKANKLYFYGVFLLFLIALIFAIGLNANNSNDCGPLYKLSIIFYILNYLSIGLSAISLFCYIPRLKNAMNNMHKEMVYMYDQFKIKRQNKEQIQLKSQE
ncbi:hypothetical protein ABPG74_006424 [Tetrahymena malaccensis]